METAITLSGTDLQRLIQALDIHRVSIEATKRMIPGRDAMLDSIEDLKSRLYAAQRECR